MRATGAALLLMLAAGCGGTEQSTTIPVTKPPPVPVAVPPAATAVDPRAPGPPVTVTRVIDGDTFEIGPRTIRVLGIDACEADTDAGDVATAQARSLLLAGPITLRPEPGVDTDRSGRELRYVGLLYGSDFGTAMVPATHAAVYDGENDAAAAYVAQLEAADPNDRTCDGPEPTTTTTTAAPEIDDEADDDRANVPDVDAQNPDRPSRPRGGRVGRDGDGDGLCNESTVPVPC